MKKIIKALIGLCLSTAVLLNMVGCGSSTQATTNTTTSAQSATTASESKTTTEATTVAPAKEIKTLTVMGHTSWFDWKGGQAVFYKINANADVVVKLELEKLPKGDQGDHTNSLLKS